MKFGSFLKVKRRSSYDKDDDDDDDADEDYDQPVSHSCLSHISCRVCVEV